MLTAIRNWVIRTMMKSKGQTGVVQSLPKRDIVEINTQITAQKLMQNGINPEALKNADQVENAIIEIESRPKVQEGIKSTQTAKIMDMKGKEIPKGSKIMGGEATETEAEIAARMSKENKEATERLRNKQKMLNDAIENMSPSLSGDRKIDAELVAEDLAERMGKVYDDLPTKERLNLYDQAYKGLTKKKFDPPEDMAQGGRAGFKSGLSKMFKEFMERRNFLKTMVGDTEKNRKARELEMLKEAMEDARKNPGFEFPSGKELRTELEKKIGPILLKDRKLNAEGGRAGFKDGLLSMLDVQAAGSKSGKQQIKGAPAGFTEDSEIINAIVKLDIPFNEKVNLLADYSYGKGRTRIEKDDQEIFLDEGGFKDRNVGLEFNRSGDGFGGKIMYNLESGEPQLNLKFKKSFADGGRAGYKFGLGPLLKLLSKNSPKQAAQKYLKSVKDRAQKGDIKSLGPEVGVIGGTGIFVNRRMQDILENMNNQEKEIDLQNYIKELNEDPFYKKYPDLKDKMIEGYTEMLFGEGRAEGGRIGLKDGMDRRTFMKVMAGLASIPILGKFFKGAKVASKAAPVAKTVTKSTPPPYFFELAETIKKFGKADKTTYQDRVEIHRMVSKDGKSELQLTEDLSTGSMQIKKIKPEKDMVNEDIVLDYRKGDVDVDPEAGTAFKEADEYTEGKEVTQKIYKDDYNEPDFYEGEGIQEIIDEIKEAPPIKKAGGGIARMLGE